MRAESHFVCKLCFRCSKTCLLSYLCSCHAKDSVPNSSTSCSPPPPSCWQSWAGLSRTGHWALNIKHGWLNLGTAYGGEEEKEELHGWEYAEDSALSSVFILPVSCFRVSSQGRTKGWCLDVAVFNTHKEHGASRSWGWASLAPTTNSWVPWGWAWAPLLGASWFELSGLFWGLFTCGSSTGN